LLGIRHWEGSGEGGRREVGLTYAIIDIWHWRPKGAKLQTASLLHPAKLKAFKKFPSNVLSKGQSDEIYRSENFGIKVDFDSSKPITPYFPFMLSARLVYEEVDVTQYLDDFHVYEKLCLPSLTILLDCV
jgi:hypothetical protein